MSRRLPSPQWRSARWLSMLVCLGTGCGALPPGGGPPGGGPPGGGPPPDGPTLEDDVLPIFRASCGGAANECHAAGVYQPKPETNCRGWLSFDEGMLGASIVGPDGRPRPSGCPDRDLSARLQQDSCQSPKKIVDPGNLANSYLWDKIDGRPVSVPPGNGPVPQSMPPGGGLAAEDKETIRLWIVNGALLRRPE